MKLLTIREVCSYLNISRSKLYDLWSDNKGPASLLIGSQRRIRQSDLEEWVGQQQKLS